MPKSLQVDWLLISLQIAVIVFAIGAPNLSAARRFFGAGTPTGTSVAALLGCVIWLVAATMVVVVAFSDLRAHAQKTRSLATMALAVAFGFVCLGIGVVRYQQVQYHSCCGNMTQTESLLAGAR